jgi:hypothetical protein
VLIVSSVEFRLMNRYFPMLLLCLAGPVTATPVTVALCPEIVAVGPALYSQHYYDAGGQPRQLLVLAGQPKLTDCDTQVVEGGAVSVAWAGLLPADLQAGRLRYLALQGKFSPKSITLSEIIGNNEGVEAAAQSPNQKAVASAPSPLQSFASSNPDRTAWLWSPSLWQDTPELVWQLQTQQHLRAIYVTVPVNADSEVENPEALAAFISAASARNLKVWAVIGDPRDVLAASRGALQSRLEAYQLYNQAAVSEARLTGVQLDIEPYLLPGFALAQQHWRDSYLAVVAFAHELLGKQLALDLVIPQWWGTHADWSEQFLNALPLPGVSLTVMNYRTDAARLRQAAEPFLKFGQRTGMPVRMALETSRLADDARRYYAGNAKAGELWLLDVRGTAVLVLLSAKVAGLPGQPFSFTEETVVSASATTFAGDLLHMSDVADEVESQWASWPTFAGIALHGLEETLAAGENK